MRPPSMPRALADPKLAGALGVPGPFPGRVDRGPQPGHDRREGKKDREAIKQALARGMKELVGCDDDDRGLAVVLRARRRRRDQGRPQRLSRSSTPRPS